RIVVQRVALPRRQRALDQVGPQRRRRIVEIPVALQAVERCALDRAGHGVRAELGPEVAQRLARAVAAVAHPALQQDGGVHRAGAGAAHRLELQPSVLDQGIEHAPGEGAVRAAALQGEIDALGRGHAAVLPGGPALRFGDMDGQGKERSLIADRGGGGPWRKRPSTILWMLSLGQLITWGLVYYTFPLFVVPMEKELGWSRNEMFGALSSGLLVAGLCSIPVGAWIDRGHGRLLMTGGSLLAAVLILAWSHVHSLALFY